MRGQWRAAIKTDRRSWNFPSSLWAPELVAKQVLSSVSGNTGLKSQLLLFKGHRFVGKGLLEAACKGGLQELITKGLVAGGRGGKRFFLTPAGTIVLRKLEQGL